VVIEWLKADKGTGTCLFYTADKPLSPCLLLSFRQVGNEALLNFSDPAPGVAVQVNLMKLLSIELFMHVPYFCMR